MEAHRDFKLGEWQVTPLRGVIVRPGESRKLTPKAMDVLMCLVRHEGAVVERETFIEEAWGGRAQSDEPLNRAIAELRRQLGDTPGSSGYIETIPKRGYRLVAPVQFIGGAPETPGLASHPTSKRRAKYLQRAVVVALLLCVAVLAWKLNESATPGNVAISLAVLPFEVNGPGDETDYFADGMQEEIIAALSRNPSLAIKSRAATVPFRESLEAPSELADELDVQMLVMGSIRRDRDRVRVTAELIDARNDLSLWSDSFDRALGMAELFSIQAEIASEIAQAMQISLSGDTSEPLDDLPTENLAAYDHFILGKYHYRRQLPGSMRLAVQNFEAAVALDPQFVDAWDWLAYAYNHAATSVGHLPPSEAYPKARAAALRALEIEPNLATSVSILGYIRAVYDWDWIGAEADLRRALALDPADSGTVWSLAHVLAMTGQHEEAIELTGRFADGDYTTGRSHVEVANRLLDAGQYDAALKRLDVAAAMDAEPAQIYDARGVAYVGLGEYGQAADVLTRAVEARQRDAGTVARLSYVLSRLGRTDEARALFDELMQRAEVERIPPLTLATAYLAVGQADVAMSLVEQAANERDREVLMIGSDPFLASLRNRDDFQDIIAGFSFPGT